MIVIYDWFGYELPIKERYRLIKEAGFDGVLLWWSEYLGRNNYLRGPLKMTVIFPKDQNVSKLIKSGLAVVHRSNTSNHLLDVSEKRSPGGFLIKVYDKERTICDIVKARDKMDSQVFTEALKAYAKDIKEIS